MAPTPPGTVTPTGDVSLIDADSNMAIDGFKLVSGSSPAGLTTSLLPGGTYHVKAHYAGDGTFGASDSTTPFVSVTVIQESSTTSISVQAFDSNGNQLSTPFPFGSTVFARADVTGASGKGIPTGTVKFSDTGNLPSQIVGITPAIANPVSLNSEGNAAIGAGVINFDAGNHSISAQYSGDISFNGSSSTQSSFTVTPGFTGVSGPTDVTISAPGGSGTTAVGIVASSNFTTAIAFTCSAPAGTEVTCSPASATGKGPTTVVKTNITVNTTAPHTTMLQSNERRYFYAVIFGGGLPLAGMLLVASPKRRRRSTLPGLMVLVLLVMVPACGGGGGGSTHTQDPGTPTNTPIPVTVTATAGSIAASGTFNLTVQ